MKFFFVALLAAILAIGLVPLTAFAEEAEVEPPVESPQYILWYASNYSDGHKEILDFEGYHDPSEPITVLDPDAAGISSAREGYSFITWNTQRDGSGKSYRPGSTISISEETTLYAQWEHEVYDITLKANSESLPYNGEEQVLSGFTGVPNGMRVEGISAQGAGTAVGTYEVTFSGTPVLYDRAGNDVTEYATFSTVPGVLTIDPRPVTVEAHNYVKAVGEDDPEFQVTVNGIVETDALGYALSRSEGEEPGLYDILVEVEAHDNYEAEVVHGTLEILAPAPPVLPPAETPAEPPFVDMEGPAAEEPAVEESVTQTPEQEPFEPESALKQADASADAPKTANAEEAAVLLTDAQAEYTAETGLHTAAYDEATVIGDMTVPLSPADPSLGSYWWIALIVAASVATGLAVKKHADKQV